MSQVSNSMVIWKALALAVSLVNKREILKGLKGTLASELLEVIHSDVCGPMVESVGGDRYLLNTVDDKSRKIFPFFLKTRSNLLINSSDSKLGWKQRR